jgi:hypothetical protein
MKPWLTIATLCCIGCVVLAPPQVKVIALFPVLYILTGIVLVTFLLPQEDVLDLFILALPAGFAFHIIYAYLISLMHVPFSLVSLCLPGLILSGLYDFKGKMTFSFNKRILILVASAIIFGIITLNLVPGEDANFHLLAIGDLMELKTVPRTYVLYPEISNLMYPLGFHILTAELQLISGVENLTFIMGPLLAAVLCVSVYWCASRLFSTEIGILAGVLAVFAALPPLNSLIFSTYANLLAYTFTCTTLGTIAIIRKRDAAGYAPFIFLSMLVAAGIETHLSFFLICIPAGLFFLQAVVRPVKRKAIMVPLMAVGLSLPYLMRISTGYTPYEIGKFLSLWYDPLELTPGMIPSRIGTWLILVGCLGCFFLEHYRLLFGSWIGIFVFLALNTIIRIHFPLWYIFFATRMVDQLFLPISIAGAFFLATMWKFTKVGVVLVCAILLVSMSSPLVNAPRADRGLLFPTTSPFFAVDQEGMYYLQSVDENAIILNEWWTATGSAWVPSLARRRVVFPYIFSLEHYVDVLKIPDKERKNFLIAAFPDSEEAHTYLKAWGVDYIFLSSYVLDEAKWRNALWNSFVLKESPNYSLRFEKGYTAIFAVSPVFEYASTVPFIERELDLSPGDTGRIDVSFSETSFPVDKILELYYEDTGWGDIILETDHSLLAITPRLNTRGDIHVAFRIPPGVRAVTITAEGEPVHARIAVSTSFWDVLSYDDDMILVGRDWSIADGNYRLSHQGHIYLLHTEGAVQITYIDTGEGNIDFNLFRNGKWEKLTTIYRENDGRKKIAILEIPPGFTLLDIGINIWGDPFMVSGLAYTGI